MTALDTRQSYQPQFGISLVRLPLLLGGALVSAVAVAWALCFLYLHHWYLLFLVPAAGAAVLTGALYLLVGTVHLRNRWLAGSIGVLTGSLAFLGYFYLCMRATLPPGIEARIDWLPSYINFRMQTDVSEDVAQPQRDNERAKKPSAGLNWYAFVFEWAIMVGMPASFAWSRARPAYCPQLAAWMVRETALFPRHTGSALREALESGGLIDYFAKTTLSGDPQQACRLILEYSEPASESALAYPLYASIEDFPVKRPWYWSETARLTMLRQLELTADEVLAMLPVFPKLTAHIESRHDELRGLSTRLKAEAAPAPAASTSEPFVIVAVPEPFRKRVHSSGYAWKVNLIGVIPGVLFFGGGGLLALGGYLVNQNQFALSVLPFCLGAVGVAWGGYTGLYCLSVYENRWIAHRLRSEIALRPDAWVDPRDPTTIFVTIIPREAWARIQLTMSSDLLLMRIDEVAGEVVMEGDCDRYRIPAAAIAACEPECFFHPIDAQHQNHLWMVRLLIGVGDNLRELLFSVDQTDWRPQTNARRKKIAESTCLRIMALRAGRGSNSNAAGTIV